MQVRVWVRCTLSRDDAEWHVRGIWLAIWRKWTRQAFIVHKAVCGLRGQCQSWWLIKALKWWVGWSRVRHLYWEHIDQAAAMFDMQAVRAGLATWQQWSLLACRLEDSFNVASHTWLRRRLKLWRLTAAKQAKQKLHSPTLVAIVAHLTVVLRTWRDRADDRCLAHNCCTHCTD